MKATTAWCWTIPSDAVWVMSCDNYVLTLDGNDVFMCYEVCIEIDWHEGFFISTVVDLCCTVTACLYARKFDLRNCQNSLMLCATCALTVYSDSFYFLWTFIYNWLAVQRSPCVITCTYWQCPVHANLCRMSYVDQLTVTCTLFRVHISDFFFANCGTFDYK